MMHSHQSSYARNIVSCNFQCLQGNMMRSITSQLSLMVDIADNKKYPKGIQILFLMEPPLVTKSRVYLMMFIQFLLKNLFELLLQQRTLPPVNVPKQKSTTRSHFLLVCIWTSPYLTFLVNLLTS